MKKRIQVLPAMASQGPAQDTWSKEIKSVEDRCQSIQTYHHEETYGFPAGDGSSRPGAEEVVKSHVQPHHEHKPTNFSSYQKDIYLNGVRGILPLMTTDPGRWEGAARAVMKPEAFAYAQGGAGNGDTIRKNREALQKWSIVPRMVRANTQRPMAVKILGRWWQSPVAVAPVGVNRIFHE